LYLPQVAIKWKIGGGFIMEIDRTIHEPILRQQERQLTEIDNEKTRLLRVIAGAQRELKLLGTLRTKCVRSIANTKDLLDLPLNAEEAALCAMPVEKECEIPEDVFKDMTIPDAAKNLLTMLGRPATHREMVELLRKGGINRGLKHLENSLRSAMVRRPDLFVFIKDDGNFGVWELMAWINATTEVLTEPIKQDLPRRAAAGRAGLRDVELARPPG